MERINRLYKIIFGGLISVFGLATLYAVQFDEAPRFILFFGRFHPLILHLPIGALLVTFFIDIIGRIQKNYPTAIVSSMLGFSAFFAIIACFLGYFLSLEGGYESNTLDLHLYAGIGTAVLATILFYMSLNEAFKSNKLFLPLFVTTLVTISVAGHFGSVLTHGDNFLFEYATTPKKEAPIEAVDSLKIFDDVVAKILDDKCISCHNSTKRKGDLSLASEQHILQGGESGEVLISGEAENSLFYTQLLLPIEDEDHMPPEGKAQLTSNEIWLLKHWIDAGLDFDNYVQNVNENDSLRALLADYLVTNKADIPKAPKSDIEKVRAAGFRVLEVFPGSSELTVKYQESIPNKRNIDRLSRLKEQIVELDFGTADITDSMIEALGSLKNLTMLKLNNPGITDASIEYIKAMENLEVLNVYNTSITNEGLADLLTSITPDKVYVWETKVDRETANQLAGQYGINIVHGEGDKLIEASQLEIPTIIPNRTLFREPMEITLSSRLRDVALHYTLNGEEPSIDSPVFSEPITIDESQTLKVAAFKDGWLPSNLVTREYVKVQHLVKEYTIEEEPDEKYPDSRKLFDLEEGSLSFGDGKWTGYYGPDLNTTIDLGASKRVNHISFSALEDVGSWILFPEHFAVYASDTKDGNFKKIGEIDIPRYGQGGEPEIKKVTVALGETEARYFKLVVKNRGTLPAWHPGAGNPSWIFVDEIFLW